ncbi:hypothetical protein MCOR02_000416 [Pyricularia oryzae]|uniref:Pre-mRNA-splicing factor 38B n=1 Tax=Pyricularia grisea TaxID=148305 RepID=A0ABQ8NCR4_PYRGI|nr:hypothetical protein MCOR01_009946 [Pyricularia oryzae]KAI6294956.1 hypothetical protein MCOR33_008025 [Pyricularia grisea]KAH9436748.1 hypothetical protein MCOR02_000416 [Pyricularia oryzae]KAI6261467.1 hypothetical protein MCOR19_002277 [Pyricularia oryzae]KAI6272750.1 hypothetical protein MCOR26_007203 [Pyricularia oryzae]
MTDQSLLTDDAVAARLIQEAEHSLRFSSYGMDSSGPRPENKPKPNTRFLRNIIRTTENHNAALLAKEAAESQARLQELSDAEEKTRQRRRPDPSEMRRRQMGKISAILLGGKRKRGGDGGSSSERRHGDERRTDERKSSKSHRSANKTSEDRERYKRRSRTTDKTDDEEECRHRERRRDRDRKSRADDSLRSSSKRDRDSHRDKERTRHRRSQSPESNERRHRRSRRDRSPLRSPKDDDRSRRKGTSGKRNHDSEDEGDYSDPLDDAIGPAPPPIKARGRGAVSQESGIDARFSKSYDPASDMRHEPADGEEWDDAVEAFRDRQKWKAQGADRLRAAGFTDDQIKKWEKSEKTLAAGADADVNIEDVRWAKKGEQREWDLGKKVNNDGTVSHGPDWAT